MKARKFFLFSALTSLVICFAAMLAGCMGFTLEEANVKKRLKDEGYTVVYRTNAEVIDGYSTPDGNGNIPAQIGTILYASSGDGVTVTLHEVWIFYCSDDDSADWVEDKTVNAAKTSGYTAYRSDLVVVYGEYTAVTVVRNY